MLKPLALALACFTILATYPLTAMCPWPKNRTLESNNPTVIEVQLEPEWLNSIRHLQSALPNQITLLDYNDPLSDELLVALNPEWMHLKETLSVLQKSELLNAALRYPFNESYHIERTLFAIAACIGADLNPDWATNQECYIGGTLFLVSSRGMSALDESVLFDDYQLAKYLLKKGANPNIPNIEHEYTLHHANSIETAKLLLEYGAIVPHNLINRCARRRYPSNLMKFYLRTIGTQTNPHASSKSPLHELMEYDETKNQIRKARLLLNAGLDGNIQDSRGETLFHCAARYRRSQLCKLLITQYVQAHHNFLEFLWLLKQNFSHFYKHKDAKRLCYLNLSPIRKLRAALEMKNKKGITAYEMWRVDALNPQTCSYETLRKLRQGQKSNE